MTDRHKTPIIRDLIVNRMTGQAIEDRSFEIIDQWEGRSRFSDDEWHVVRRLVHTTADFGLADLIRFSSSAIDSGSAAMREGCNIYADSNMIRAGLSLARLKDVSKDFSPDRILCHVADPDVAETAEREGLPRSLFAVRKAAEKLQGAIAVIGNAPVALMELNRLIMEAAVQPALVIGMPVGFVHVVESKEELMQLDVPYITIEGRRGGSPLAVSVVHALCAVAGSRMEAGT
jgi:precorrin isomerase